MSIFVIPLTLLSRKKSQKQRRSKTLFKVDIYTTEGFENAMVQCERANIDKKNAAIATTQNTCSMAPLQCDLTKAQQCEQIKDIKKR